MRTPKRPFIEGFLTRSTAVPGALVLISILLLVSILGACREKADTLRLDELTNRATQAQEEIETYRFDITGTIMMSIGDPEDSMHINMEFGLTGEGIVKIPDQEMYLGLSFELMGSQIQLERWVKDAVSYQRESEFGVTGDWSIEEVEWEEEAFPLESLPEFLKLSTARLAGREILDDGTGCHVVSVEVDSEMARRGMPPLPLLTEEEFDEGLDKAEVTLWYDEEAFLPKRMVLMMMGSMAQDDEAIINPYENEEEPPAKLKANLGIDFHSFNEPVLIELPPDAEFETGLSGKNELAPRPGVSL